MFTKSAASWCSRIARPVVWLVRVTGLDFRDAVTAISLALIADGVAMINVPAALIVTGVLLFVLATWPLMTRHGEKNGHSS